MKREEMCAVFSPHRLSGLGTSCDPTLANNPDGVGLREPVPDAGLAASLTQGTDPISSEENHDRDRYRQ